MRQREKWALNWYGQNRLRLWSTVNTSLGHDWQTDRHKASAHTMISIFHFQSIFLLSLLLRSWMSGPHTIQYFITPLRHACWHICTFDKSSSCSASTLCLLCSLWLSVCLFDYLSNPYHKLTPDMMQFDLGVACFRNPNNNDTTNHPHLANKLINNRSQCKKRRKKTQKKTL